MSYKEAKEFVKKLNLKSKTDFYKFLKNEIYSEIEIPIELPRDPRHWYLKSEEWKGWGDFLGKE